MYKILPKDLGHFEIAVCGGGVAGTAAAECINKKVLPAEIDGKTVSAFMSAKGYEI